MAVENVTPLTPLAPVSALRTTISADLSWLKTHLLLLLVVVLLAAGAVYSVEAIVAKHDASNDSKWAQILAAQNSQTQLVQNQLAKVEADNAARDLQAQATIQKLSSAISQRAIQSAAQQKTDASLTAATAAERLGQQINQPAAVRPQADGTVSVDLPAARAVVADEDRLTQFAADLADVKTQLSQQVILTADANSNIAAQKLLITNLQKNLVDQKAADDAALKVVVANARKSKLRWFGAGVVVGFLGGLFAK